jgi:hypothetical protein
LKAVIWTPGTDLGELSAERVAEIRSTSTGPLVAVLDDNDGVMIIQPINPDTGADWESEEAALAFAERYMTPPPADIPLPTIEE